jgi:hypothetical protein
MMMLQLLPRLLMLLFAATAPRLARADWCPNFCSGHGTCVDDDICECFDDWINNDCSERVCPFGMSWVLSTEDELSASAAPSYPLGRRAYVECSNKGECDRATGVCQCYDGFSGAGCRRTDCPNDCSGNGVCVLEADVAGYFGQSKLLFAQKEYWNGEMSRRCMCDSHFWGNDCSQRLCPQGADPEIDLCGDAVEPARDVQMVTASLVNDLALLDPSELDQYFTLTFTDAFDAQVTTRPISFWEDAAGVQAALLALPNFAVMDVEVVKFWPLNDYDGTVAPDRGGTTQSSTLQSAGHLRELACERLHHDLFASTACTDDADCTTSFGLAATHVLCDANILQCVETDKALCAVVDGATEFRAGGGALGCGSTFEPNGVYEDDAGVRYWGRRLSSADRACHVGTFDSDDATYARTCSTDTDCALCTSWSQVRAGVCNGGRCGVSDEYSAVVSQDAVNECRVTTWAVKFTHALNAGTQALLSCTHGSLSTNQPGASPRFRSAGLVGCQVLRAGVPEWTFAGAEEGTDEAELRLCFSTDDSLATTGSFVAGTEAASGVASGAYDRCFRLMASPSDQQDDINLVTADQNALLHVQQPQEGRNEDGGALSGLHYPNDPLFAEEEVEVADVAVYDEVLPCANEGACQQDGTCKCRDGFYGSSCELRLDYV